MKGGSLVFLSSRLDGCVLTAEVLAQKGLVRTKQLSEMKSARSSAGFEVAVAALTEIAAAAGELVAVVEDSRYIELAAAESGVLAVGLGSENPWIEVVFDHCSRKGRD